jgi:hypothetical protein
MSTNEEFQESFKIGSETEDMISIILKAQGEYVLKTADFSKGNQEVPSIIGLLDRVTMPDLLVFSLKGPHWGEVKFRTKTWRNPWLKPEKQKEEVNIEHRLILEYAKIQTITSIPVKIYFYVQEKNAVFFNDLDEAVSKGKRRTILGKESNCFCLDDFNKMDI